MADIQDFIDQVRTKLAALTPALSTQAPHSDHRTDLDALAAGATVYRIRHQEEQATRDSNQQIQSASIVLEISHYLADSFDERAYTEGDMLTHMASVMDREWWRVAAVRDITGGPENEDNVDREGNIISWSVLVTVAIVPA